MKKRRRKENQLRKSSLGAQKPPADGERRDASLSRYLSGFPALLPSSPFKVTFLVGLSVCPRPCGDPGMVMCSAWRYLWSLTSAQVSGEGLHTPSRQEAEG